MALPKASVRQRLRHAFFIARKACPATARRAAPLAKQELRTAGRLRLWTGGILQSAMPAHSARAALCAARRCEVKSQCAEEERVLPKVENSAFSCPAGRIGGAGAQGGRRLPWRQKPRQGFCVLHRPPTREVRRYLGPPENFPAFLAGSSVKKPGEPSGPPGRLNMAGAQAAGSKLMLSRAGAPLFLPALQALEKLRAATARGMRCKMPRPGHKSQAEGVVLMKKSMYNRKNGQKRRLPPHTGAQRRRAPGRRDEKGACSL